MNLEYFENLRMFLARILRHSPETININIDEHGWADDDLVCLYYNKKD